MRGSYSMDPAVLNDGDGNYYMYFGGLWGGQLQRYRDNKALESGATFTQTTSRPSPDALPNSVRICCNLPKNLKP